MDAYSLELRKKIVEAKERDVPTVEVARTFGVGLSCVKRYAATARGEIPRPEEEPRLQAQAGRRRQEAPEGRPREAPGGATLPQRREFLQRACGGFGERLHALMGAQAPGMDPKKRSVGASERDEFLRAPWRVMVAATTRPTRAFGLRR